MQLFGILSKDEYTKEKENEFFLDPTVLALVSLATFTSICLYNHYKLAPVRRPEPHPQNLMSHNWLDKDRSIGPMQETVASACLGAMRLKCMK